MRLSFQKYRVYFVIVVLLFSTCLHAASSRKNLRGARYCEVLLSNGLLTVDVYNTLGLNHCPEKLWRTVSKKQIKKENDADFVALNGPRYFMMDAIKNASLVSKKVKFFNGISMRLAGVLHIKMLELINTRAYQRHEVERHTTWVYAAHKPIYELIDDKGRAYVLQSYSVQYSPQTVKSLATLDRRLKLPRGWHFRTGLLKKTSEVVAVDNKAIVIQDAYRNTYQLAARDLLE